MSVKRLFIALPVEDEGVLEELVSAREQVAELLRNVQFRPEHQSHITVRFIGDTDPDVASRLHRDLSAFARDTEAFTALTLGYCFTFSGVLCCGLGGEEEELNRLDQVFDRIDRTVRSHGLPPPDFPPVPHITLARFARNQTDAVKGAILTAEYPRLLPLPLGRLVLMESTRNGDGSITYAPAFED